MLRPGLRLAFVLGAGPLPILPVGDVTVMLALLLALDVAVAVSVLREALPALLAVVPAREKASFSLRLRTHPGFRMRRRRFSNGDAPRRAA